MKNRVVFGILFALFAFGMIVGSEVTRLVFFFFCGGCACWEMRNALQKCGYHIPAWFVYSVFILCSGLIVLDHIGYAYPVFMILIVAVFGQMILVGNIGVKDLFACFGMVAYPLSFIMVCVYVSRDAFTVDEKYLADCAYVVKDTRLWAPIYLTSILPAIVSDTFALFGGRRFGKHKLCPAISPNKTVEGLVCGLIMGTLSGFVIHFVLNALSLYHIPLWAELISALLAALAGALGDLAASSVKREAGIKDYSKLIPGHGGMLDRVDSSIFAIPVIYMMYALFI